MTMNVRGFSPTPFWVGEWGGGICCCFFIQLTVVPKLLEKGKFFWQFEKENFDSFKRKTLTVLKGKFWQFEKENFDSLKRGILTVWKGEFWQFWKEKFWQFKKENFDSLKKIILTVWKREILTVRKRKILTVRDAQFENHCNRILCKSRTFHSLNRDEKYGN
jgi:hypothetical protein